MKKFVVKIGVITSFVRLFFSIGPIRSCSVYQKITIFNILYVFSVVTLQNVNDVFWYAWDSNLCTNSFRNRQLPIRADRLLTGTITAGKKWRSIEAQWRAREVIAMSSQSHNRDTIQLRCHKVTRMMAGKNARRIVNCLSRWTRN